MTVGKSALLFGLAVAHAFLVDDPDFLNASSTSFLDALSEVSESYLSCCVFNITSKKRATRKEYVFLAMSSF